MTPRLFIGNLPFRTREEEVLHLFEEAGTVVCCNLIVELIVDRGASLSKGFAFVEMGSEEEAVRAISLFNGRRLGGHALIVNEAGPRERGDFGETAFDGDWRSDRHRRY
jgi:RNA recognition motif-containing protein